MYLHFSNYYYHYYYGDDYDDYVGLPLRRSDGSPFS